MILITTQVFPPSVGGIQNLMASLAYHAATTAKHPVHVFADKTPQSDKFDSEIRTAYDVTRVGGLKPWRRWRKAHIVAQAATKTNVSHIFADSWKSIEYLPSSLTPPVIAFAHGNEYPIDLSKQNRIKRCLGKVDHLIAVSNDTRDRIIPFLPENSPDVHVINPPVGPCEHPTDKDRQSVAAMWKHEAVRILCLSRLVDMKGIDATIKAIAKLRNDGAEAELVVAGSGPDRARLDALVAELGLGGHVNFVGYVQGGLKTALLESADIYMQPGRAMRQEREAFGISYLEAGLCGLPSIAGKAGGSGEAVIDGETGLVVDGADDRAVYQSLTRLTKDTAFKDLLGQNARAHAQKFLWPQQIERILSIAL